jgi:hypothetical protein
MGPAGGHFDNAPGCPGEAYALPMGSKAPPSGQNKKPGKTPKEKRAEKKAKKDERSKRTI